MLIKSKQPCPDCGSKDNLTIYDNGTHCFGCKVDHFNDSSESTVFSAAKIPKDNSYMLKEVQGFPCAALDSRKINQEVAEKYGVKTEYDQSTGLPIKYYFPYRKGNEIVGYKVRSVKEKDFYAVGSTSNTELFGQHLVGEGGKLLIITEGEMDALAASQMLKDCGKNYKVVSIPNGASSASAAIKHNIEFLEEFETIMINFDADKAGQAATQEVVDIFSPGKVKIMTLPDKDANDMI